MVTEKEHEDAQKEFFNKVCYEWDKTFDSRRGEQDALVREIGLTGDEKILDVATGLGVMVPSYLRCLKGGSVYAIDYSENMIKLAKERFPKEKYPNVDFEVMNLFDLESVSEFDLVVCYSCLPHFFDHDRAISVMSRSLTQGGRFVVCNLKYHHVNRSGDSADRRKMMEHMPEHRFLTIPQLVSLCDKHSLRLNYACDDDYHTVLSFRKVEEPEIV